MKNKRLLSLVMLMGMQGTALQATLTPLLQKASFSDAVIKASHETAARYNRQDMLPPVSESSNSLNLFSICNLQYASLHDALLATLIELHTHLEYWKNKQFQAIKLPHLFYPNPEDKNVDHMSHLEQEISANEYYLGKITAQMQEVLTNYSSSAINNLILTIHQCAVTRFKQQIEHPTVVSDDLLLQNYYHISQYTTTVMHSLKGHTAPNHFQRHWFAYGSGAIALGAAALFMYKNQDTIPDWIKHNKRLVGAFLESKIYGPVLSLRQTMLGKTDKPLITENQIKAATTSLQQIAEQLKIPTQGLSPEAITGEIDKQWVKALNSPTYNLATGNIIHLLGAKIQGLEIPLLRGVAQLDDAVLKSNQLTFRLLATVPAAAAVYVAYAGLKKVGQKCYSLMHPTKNVRQPIKESLRIIEKILNTRNTESQTLTFEELGSIVYQLYQLKKIAIWLPKELYFNFREDCEQLESHELSIVQKIAVIERMYRHYNFLIPQVAKA